MHSKVEIGPVSPTLRLEAQGEDILVRRIRVWLTEVAKHLNAGRFGRIVGAAVRFIPEPDDRDGAGSGQVEVTSAGVDAGTEEVLPQPIIPLGRVIGSRRNDARAEMPASP